MESKIEVVKLKDIFKVDNYNKFKIIVELNNEEIILYTTLPKGYKLDFSLGKNLLCFLDCKSSPSSKHYEYRNLPISFLNQDSKRVCFVSPQDGSGDRISLD